ncbi:MAG TPA: class I SAM-dependent methyltransferase [Pedococcus sp.]|nr:class I SAM-dependent methyltransferase [Pedococcus sp.]
MNTSAGTAAAPDDRVRGADRPDVARRADQHLAQPFAQEGSADTLADRLVGATIAALELFSVHLGRELGLYQALAGRSLTYPELAERAAITPRYAREWLEQQAVAGLVEVVGPEPHGGHDRAAVADDDRRDSTDRDHPEQRRYGLPAAHQRVLLAPDDATHVAPLADMVAGVGGVLRDLPRAYRTGSGVAYAAYGRAFRRGQAGVNRPVFANDLHSWMDAMPDVAARVASDPLARVADIGCGEGWSTLALAREFPLASVDGYDSDPASIDAARRQAAAAGLAGRVVFHLEDASSPDALHQPYDLVLVFEALHDMARPREVLAALRAALSGDGAILVADERVAETFTAPGDDVERLMYGWSVTHCLPASLADIPSAALGTVLRSDTVHALAAQAGFTTSRELSVDNDFFRFYRLDP